MYDKFSLRLESTPVSPSETISPSVADSTAVDWAPDVDVLLRRLTPNTRKAPQIWHILERINMSFARFKMPLSTRPILLRFKIAGEMPELQSTSPTGSTRRS